jgi:PAS domain S-box-containing protein
MSPTSRQPGQVALPPASSELEFRRLLDRLPAGAYTCDAGGLITYFNEQAKVLWGRAPKLNDAIDRYCGSFKLYAADGTPIKHDACWMAKALQTGEEFNGQEIIVERPDGTRLNVLAHANPIRDPAGQIVGAVNVLVDVSDRKRAIDAQTLLAAIVESSDDAIVSKTLEGQILSWNSGAERLFGYSAAEAVGSSIMLIIPPERRDEELTIISRLRRGERIDHYETVRITKDRRRIDISVTISPLRDSTGRVVGASKVARDITQRKQAEQALVALKDQLGTQVADLRRLHEMSSRLSTTLDLQPILDETLRTAAAIEGADFGLLALWDPEIRRLRVGSSFGLQQDYLELVEGLPEGAGAEGVAYSQRRRAIVEDAEIDPIYVSFREAARSAGFRSVHCTPLVTRSGQVMGVLSTYFRRPHHPSDREMHLIDLCARQAVDFIENARLYAQLQSIDRSKDEFLAVLAHELRNPLAPIRNSLQIFRLSGELTPSGERLHAVMDRQVNQLVRLVDDLLEVSRISQSKIELRMERMELASVILSAIETSRPLIEEARHQLAISIPAEPLTLVADSVRLGQVVANLLNNAAKYTPEGGQIWLHVRREPGEVVISVRDTGIGIAAEMMPRVFDMFAQVQPNAARTQGGLGIGLTLVKRLTEMHGGSVDVKSEGPGKGSEFIVRLPLARADQLAPIVRVIEDEPRSFKPRRILVVDDNRDAADSLGMFLKILGAEVQVAYDGVAALQLLPVFRPAVLLLDIGMPGLDGYEVARRVRQSEAAQNLLLVAMTGWGQDDDRRRSAAAGFDHHLVKPVNPVALQNLLARFDEGGVPQPTMN